MHRMESVLMMVSWNTAGWNIQMDLQQPIMGQVLVIQMESARMLLTIGSFAEMFSKIFTHLTVQIIFGILLC